MTNQELLSALVDELPAPAPVEPFVLLDDARLPRASTPVEPAAFVLACALEQLSDPDAWRENDRLRADASRMLVDAAIAAGAAVYVQPTVAFVYPPDGPVSEDTPVGEVPPILRSALASDWHPQQ
jgi:hypothetical protein